MHDSCNHIWFWFICLDFVDKDKECLKVYIHSENKEVECMINISQMKLTMHEVKRDNNETMDLKLKSSLAEFLGIKFIFSFVIYRIAIQCESFMHHCVQCWFQ